MTVVTSDTSFLILCLIAILSIAFMYYQEYLEEDIMVVLCTILPILLTIFRLKQEPLQQLKNSDIDNNKYGVYFEEREVLRNNKNHEIDINISGLKFNDSLSIFLDYFNYTWPPCTQFINWPNEYLIYKQIADEMVKKLDEYNDIDRFRNWMFNKFANNITDNEWNNILIAINNDFKIAKNKHNPILFGLLGCLTRLITSYRWGIMPLTPLNVLKNDNNNKEKKIIFPKYLFNVWSIINKFYGLPNSTCTPNITFANSIIKKNMNKPIGIRFTWNYHDINRETEEKVMNLFIASEIYAKNLLLSINKSLNYFFENVNKLKNNDNKCIDKYLLLIDQIEKDFNETIKNFGKKFHEKYINSKRYFECVTGPASWKLGKLNGGPSASQQIVTGIMDIFVVNFQNSKYVKNYLNNVKDGMLTIQTQLFDSLLYTVNLRENLISINELNIKISNKFYKLASRLRGWRITHRNKVFKAIKNGNSIQSARGNLKANINNNINDNIANNFYQSMTKFIQSVENTRSNYLI